MTASDGSARTCKTLGRPTTGPSRRPSWPTTRLWRCSTAKERVVRGYRKSTGASPGCGQSGETKHSPLASFVTERKPSKPPGCGSSEAVTRLVLCRPLAGSLPYDSPGESEPSSPQCRDRPRLGGLHGPPLALRLHSCDHTSGSTPGTWRGCVYVGV